MSISLDAGDILAQEAIDILPEETAGELESRLGPLGAKLAFETVAKLAVGPVFGIPQDKSQVTKAPKLTKEHGLIDWSRSAAGVISQIRAMQPWPTAYTHLHRQGQPPLRLIVCRAAVTSRERERAGVGAVAADAAKLFACCGDGGWIEITELQPASKRRMSAQEFLRGNAIPPD